jgi:hypothetical protein
MQNAVMNLIPALGLSTGNQPCTFSGMHTVEDLLEPYAVLESAVCRLMQQLFAETCGLCTACCCRADVCEEVTCSAFLTLLLKQQGVSPTDMDDRFGWLDLHGCSLAYGRPPICYSYFCDELLEAWPDEESRLVLMTLGRLMHHVGIDALGKRHLVEIADAGDLARIDADRLLLRLNEASAAFDMIEECLRTGRLAVNAMEVLDMISPDEP